MQVVIKVEIFLLSGGSEEVCLLNFSSHHKCTNGRYRTNSPANSPSLFDVPCSPCPAALFASRRSATLSTASESVRSRSLEATRKENRSMIQTFEDAEAPYQIIKSKLCTLWRLSDRNDDQVG